MTMKPITRRGLLALAGASAIALAGCSSAGDDAGSAGQQSTAEVKQSTVPAEPQDLVITESGWSVDDQGYVHYGVGVQNPNMDKEADLPSFTITGKAEDGSIVFSDTQTLLFIAPGETVYYGFQAGNGTAPATVEFAIADCTFADCEPFEEDVFTVSNTSEVVSQYGTVSYTGELTMNADTSANPDMFDQTAVTAILRNADGAIVYGMSTFVSTPAQDATSPFEIPAYNVPEHASFEVYAQLW